MGPWCLNKLAPKGKSLTAAQLEWRPQSTKSLALICQDPDAPSGVTHWTMYNIPVKSRFLTEVLKLRRICTHQGKNDAGQLDILGQNLLVVKSIITFQLLHWRMILEFARRHDSAKHYNGFAKYQRRVRTTALYGTPGPHYAAPAHLTMSRIETKNWSEPWSKMIKIWQTRRSNMQPRNRSKNIRSTGHGEDQGQYRWQPWSHYDARGSTWHDY